MDASAFSEQKTGDLVRIRIPQQDWAFIPHPLPPQWKFPAKLWPALAEAKQELARLDGIGRALPDSELLLQPLQRREALRSSSLEGTYASPKDLLLFEMRPRTPTSEADPANDWLEVANYSKALRQGVELLGDLPLSLRLIREMHGTLLTGVRGRERNPGEFRRHQVHVGSDRRYIPPPADHLGRCLDRFEKRMHEDDPEFDPLVRCYLLHYQFEAIHPFSDGNGRVGRALLSLMVFHGCKLTRPWLYMSAFFERYRDEYIQRLFRVSTHGAWEDWIAFCLRGTIDQALDSVRRCEALDRLKRRFHEVAGASSTRAHPIIEGLFSAPLVTAPMIAERFSVSYPTARSDISRLEKLGILKPLSETRPQVYFAPEVFAAAYDEE